MSQGLGNKWDRDGADVKMATARASYYAHPLPQLHEYLDRERSLSNAEALRGGTIMSGRTGPYIKPAIQSKYKDADGTDAHAAVAPGSPRAETETRPGPTAQEVKAFLAGMETIEKATGDVERPIGGEDGFWSVKDRMDPHLQLMCGPLLAYYTVLDGIWHGAALVVANDAGSDYTRIPFVSLTFDCALEGVGQVSVPTITVEGRKIYTYRHSVGEYSFWRFLLEIPLQSLEMRVRYRVNGGAILCFVVPARDQNFRWATHSCPGFSAGVNPDDFRGSYASGYDPLWEDMLHLHEQKRFHCMVGGGDQIYGDPVTLEPELRTWINAPHRKEKLAHPLTDEMKVAIDRFYFNHYCKMFRTGAFARANSSIPMTNMLDDHDLIDGFGSYDDETQASPVMSRIGSRGYFWFLLFQLFVCDEFDGASIVPGSHPIKSLLIGGPGAWIPFRSHSLSASLGPKVHLLAVDCRAERRLDRIVSSQTYSILFDEIRKLKGRGIEHLVILLGVPIAYPRMSFLEHFLGFKWNPFNALARHHALGLGKLVNNYNEASELLDDLNDHWCANVHKRERNWLVRECQRLALEMHVRITFLSGDVHLAAVGCLFTKQKGGQGHQLPATEDYRYMLNVVTSAIVNTPPPRGAAMMVSLLSSHKHRTLHKDLTDEIMLPLFTNDTDGSPMKRQFVMARRNYATVDCLASGELLFDLRIEKFKGAGETKSYPLRVPPPRWQ